MGTNSDGEAFWGSEGSRVHGFRVQALGFGLQPLGFRV